MSALQPQRAARRAAAIQQQLDDTPEPAMSMAMRKATQWYHSPDNVALLARFGLSCELVEDKPGVVWRYLHVSKEVLLSFSGFTRDHKPLVVRLDREERFFLVENDMDRLLWACQWTLEDGPLKWPFEIRRPTSSNTLSLCLLPLPGERGVQS